MSLEKYTSLSSWMGRYACRPAQISPDVTATKEGKAALAALNDLAELLRNGDVAAMEELFKMRHRDEWLRQNGCTDETKDEFYYIPQTD